MSLPSQPLIGETAERPSVEAEVVFGSLSKNCRGVGICKVDVHGHARSACKKCPCRTQAQITVLENGRVRFAFETSRLNKFIFNRYFRNLEFPVPEGFVFPPDLLQVLGLSQFIIKPGIYPVHALDGSVSVDFRAAEHSTIGKVRRHMQLLCRASAKQSSVAAAS